MSSEKELVELCKQKWCCEPTIQVAKIPNYRSPKAGLPIYSIDVILPDKQRFHTIGHSSIQKLKDEMCRAAIRALSKTPAILPIAPLSTIKREKRIPVARKARWVVHVHALLDSTIKAELLEQYPDVLFVVFTTGDALKPRPHSNYREVVVCQALDSKLASNKVILQMILETQLVYLSIIAESHDNVLGDELLGVLVIAPQGMATDGFPTTEHADVVKLGHSENDLHATLAHFRHLVPLTD